MVTSRILAATVALALAAIKFETLYQANSFWLPYIIDGILATIIYDALRVFLDGVLGKDPIRLGEAEVSKKEPVRYYFIVGSCIPVLVLFIHKMFTWHSEFF